MRRLVVAATFGAVFGVLPAHSAVVVAPFNCTTGTICGTALMKIPSNYGNGSVYSVSCEWSAGTVTKLELNVASANGATIYEKMFFPILPEEKTARAATKSVVRGSAAYFLPIDNTTGQLLRVVLTTSTAGANKGTCYIVRRD
ncbi:hypothetical protein DK847_19990 [Aestuariivirga litoralis]|uniref:Uncharacterized protein n=1 Tax=Aestuariivirga litoralis TaxID=2650924 RepID=A0A2W2AIM1_9HYPH|nr:hypothetical protein [Aestuariivirga litoralis]PZF75131.1 hypothetical protein DK847_19990 [Aestuariivirga litoralis]